MAVVSASLRLNLQSSLFSDGARPIVVTPNNAEAAARDRTAAHADIVMTGEDAVDLQSALRQLHSRGVRLVVCEGGPLLLAELLAGGVVGKLCLTVSPLLVADPVRLLPAGALAQPAALRLAHVLEDDGHLFLRYLLGRPADQGECSIDPARCLVCLSSRSHTLAVATRRDRLAVHLLDEDDYELSLLFGEQTGDEVDKFAACDRQEEHGVPACRY